MTEFATNVLAEIESCYIAVVHLRGMVDHLSSDLETISDTHIRLAGLLNSHQPSPTVKPLICLPDKWNGLDGKPDVQIASLDIIFECQLVIYTASASRVGLLTSLLSRRVQEWAAAPYNQKSPLCKDHTLFVAEL